MSCLTFEKENITNPSNGFNNNEVFHHDFQFSQSLHVETPLTNTEVSGFRIIKNVSNDFVERDCFIKENKTFTPSKPEENSIQNSRRRTLISSRSSCIPDEKCYDRYPSPYKSKSRTYLSRSASDISIARSNEGRMRLTNSDSITPPKPIRSHSYIELPKPNLGVSQKQKKYFKGPPNTLLPCYKYVGKRFRYIDQQTMCKLLRGEYTDTIDEFCIIDCRYDYEYTGGHIKGSMNFGSYEEMLERFFSPEIIESKSEFNNTALIFHCEFSIKRGPLTYESFRKYDRKLNTDAYPFLHYPHIYVLEGGYCKFFEECKELCTPCSYVPMNDERYKDKRKSMIIEENNYFDPIKRSKSFSLFRS